jgi:dTDP-4-dehydrorhamnose reductase
LKRIISFLDPALKKLLVVGGTGLVGSKLLALAGRHGFEGYSTHNARQVIVGSASRLDVTDRSATFGLVERVWPDVVVDTHALHNVDYCETHREEAARVNVEGTRNLVDAASKTGARFVYVSTDYVFDGKKGQYREDDHPNPLHYYAQNKVEAERLVADLPSYVISRPSVIYGWNLLERSGVPSSSGKTVNFAMFILDKFRKGETVKAVSDQYSSPTLADNMAEALLRLAKMDVNGVYHTAGRSCVSRYEFASKAAQIFGYPASLVQPVSSADFKQVAERPRNSCLSVEKAEKTLGIHFLTVEEGLREMKSQEVAGLASSPVPTR